MSLIKIAALKLISRSGGTSLVNVGINMMERASAAVAKHGKTEAGKINALREMAKTRMAGRNKEIGKKLNNVHGMGKQSLPNKKIITKIFEKSVQNKAIGKMKNMPSAQKEHFMNLVDS